MLSTRLRRLAVITSVGGAAIAGLLLAGPAIPSSAVDAVHSTPTGRNIDVTTITAQPLSTGAVLTPRERVIIVVRDFAPRCAVTVSLRTGGTIQSLPPAVSTAAGVLRLVYQVPASTPPGQRVLTFVGAGPPTSAGPGSADVVATVPNLAEFAFAVSHSAGQ